MARGGAAASFDTSFERGAVPAFRVGERDRVAFGPSVAGWLGARVCVRADWAWRVDLTGAGAPVSGPGDLVLGTSIDALALPGVGAGVGWSVKLPNASAPLGTDEADVGFGAWVAWARGPLAARGGVGLEILGNPLRFASQDDVPHAWLEGDVRAGDVVVGPRLDLEVATSRNPARSRVGAEVVVGRRAFGRLGLFGGLSPAAPDWAVALSVGLRALPERGDGV
jgi:hypothetical protein